MASRPFQNYLRQSHNMPKLASSWESDRFVMDEGTYLGEPPDCCIWIMAAIPDGGCKWTSVIQVWDR